MLIDVRLERIEIALPEGFEDQPVSGLRPFEEAGDVEAGSAARIARTPGPAGGTNAMSPRVRRRRRGRGCANPRLDSRVRIGRLEDRLLLMARALAEHAVEAQPDEQGNQREDDYDSQAYRSYSI